MAAIPTMRLRRTETDLNPEASGDIFEYYDAENERFIVQWNEIRPFNAPGGNNLTFQTILYPDGGIISSTNICALWWL
jgi:hypothetical protein